MLLPPSILSSRWEKFTWPTERLQIWVTGQRQCMCVTWIKSILSISFLKISPVPPVMLPPTHQMHAPESRRLPEIDLNLRGNYFPRDLFVCFFFFFSFWLTYVVIAVKGGGMIDVRHAFGHSRRPAAAEVAAVHLTACHFSPPPPQKHRPSAVRHQARIHSHTWSHFISGQTWVNIPVDTLSSPETLFAGEEATNRPNHFVCVFFCAFWSVKTALWVLVLCLRTSHTGLSRELTDKVRPPSRWDSG